MSDTKNPANPADGTFVVVQNGQRVTAPMESRQAADAETAKHNQLAESGGKAVPESQRAATKQNLCG